jgi:ribonuclease VapC
MFVDTSVFVALLASEPDADHFAEKIEAAKNPITSGLVMLESAMRLSSLLDLDPGVVEERILALLEEANIAVVSIDGTVAKVAITAFATYGKGRGHPAKLNLADCMSYACARVHRVPLLFKGNDFSKTDIHIA